MNHKVLSLLAVIPFLGCESSETSLVVQGVVPGELDMTTGGCTWDPETDVYLARVSIDVAQQLTLLLQLQVENTLTPGTVEIDEEPNDVWVYSESITPLRFDYRWECDTIGFSADLGPMYLPQFSVNQPFCLDNRDETTGNFVGFDVIPATGASIEPGATGLAEVRMVPAQLGIAVNDMFALAELAQGCCDSTDGCAGVESGANNACNMLSAFFNDVGILQNQTEAARRYRPFSLFDGNTPPTNVAGMPTPFYSMRVRGVLEGVTGSGDLVTSNEWAQDIAFGRNTTQGSSVCTGF